MLKTTILGKRLKVLLIFFKSSCVFQSDHFLWSTKHVLKKNSFAGMYFKNGNLSLHKVKMFGSSFREENTKPTSTGQAVQTLSLMASSFLPAV